MHAIRVGCTDKRLALGAYHLTGAANELGKSFAVYRIEFVRVDVLCLRVNTMTLFVLLDDRRVVTVRAGLITGLPVHVSDQTHDKSVNFVVDGLVDFLEFQLAHGRLGVAEYTGQALVLVPGPHPHVRVPSQVPAFGPEATIAPDANHVERCEFQIDFQAVTMGRFNSHGQNVELLTLFAEKFPVDRLQALVDRSYPERVVWGQGK